MNTVWEGEGGMIWENSIETYTLPYAKQIASGSLLYDAGNPKLRLWDNLEEWHGAGGGSGGRGVWFEREGTCVYLMLVNVDVWQKPPRYCKVSASN